MPIGWARVIRPTTPGCRAGDIVALLDEWPAPGYLRGEGVLIYLAHRIGRGGNIVAFSHEIERIKPPCPATT